MIISAAMNNVDRVKEKEKEWLDILALKITVTQKVSHEETTTGDAIPIVGKTLAVNEAVQVSTPLPKPTVSTQPCSSQNQPLPHSP